MIEPAWISVRTSSRAQLGPWWDFDLPCDLPFLSETAKRNILGENAIRLFKLGGNKLAHADNQLGLMDHLISSSW
jgi:hypothetical protein